jgi:Pyridoxamine 5'-phosphate oxidase
MRVDAGAMANWNDLVTAVPELAGAVRGRFEAHGLALLATLRRDGSPRISGIEPLVTDDQLWLGMMDGSLKGADLRRDPRLALHNATIDKEVTEGDAKVAGRAVEVRDPAAIDAFLTELRTRTGYAPEGPFDLFRVDVTEMSLIRPGGDHLLIESWREGRGLRRVERR